MNELLLKSHKELLVILKQIILKDYHSLSQNDKEEILGYLESKPPMLPRDSEHQRTLYRGCLTIRSGPITMAREMPGSHYALSCCERDDRLALVEETWTTPPLAARGLA